MKEEVGLDVFQKLIQALDGRVQIYTQLPASLRGVALEHLHAGYVDGEYIWYAASELSGKQLYMAGQIEHLSRAERYLLQMAIRAIPMSESSGQNWERKISDALHEPLEPYGSAIRIEDEVENILVPWNWPVYLISLRPDERSTAEIVGEVSKNFESLADDTDLVVHIVVEPSMIVGVISLHKSTEAPAFSGLEIAEALVDGLMSESFVKVRAIYSESIRSFPELLRMVKRMHYIFQAAERFQVEQPVYSVRGIGFFELLFTTKSQLRQAYTDHILPPSILNALGTELEQTVMMFIQNNLNMSETARQLYLHRNSLLYRIERIKELTGYDIRMFRDAVTVWVALLLKRL